MPRPHVAVIGAGAFGGWTALWLLRRGARVTLVDACGPGNPRSSSGGQTRVFRHAYPDPLHVRLARRARALWLDADRRWGRGLYHERGVLFIERAGEFIAHATTHLQAAGIPFENLDARQLARRWPMFRLEGDERALFEPAAGHLDAARACRAVVDAFVEAGGEVRHAQAMPAPPDRDGMGPLRLSDGSMLAADHYVFACGPWLKRLFHDLFGASLRITRQEVHYFERPPKWPADPPTWAHLGARFWYGVPGTWFKIADDTRGPEVDPDTQSRAPSEDSMAAAAAALRERFHGFDEPCWRASEVCQYSQTVDHRFVFDRHPALANAWLLGGGSGHGFKHGPAIGECVADAVLGQRDPPPEWTLNRLG